MIVCGKKIKVQGRLLRIARLDADTYHFIDDPETMIKGLSECDAKIDLFTFMQRVTDTQPKFKYPMEWHNQAVLPVSSYDHWWNKQIEGRLRVKVRKAQKNGVEVRVVPFDDELVRGIWEIYNECPVRQGRPFRHYGMDLETVHRVESTYLDSSIFIAAYHESKMIGFIKLVADETWSQANLMNIVSMVQHSNKAPTNALIAKSIEACADKGIQNLIYGHFVYKNKKPDGITVFKRYNGFERVYVPRYYVPLTALGRAALQFGFHHRIAERLPQQMVDQVRELRNRWQTRGVQSQKMSSSS